jgi:hypothetical protein
MPGGPDARPARTTRALSDMKFPRPPVDASCLLLEVAGHRAGELKVKANNHETHRREIAGSYRARLLAGDNGAR